MLEFFKRILQARREHKETNEYIKDIEDKNRLCQRCSVFCGDELCEKIGCLNTDMRQNYTRLRNLVSRLEKTGYTFSTRAHEFAIFDSSRTTEPYVIIEPEEGNIVRVRFPHNEKN